MAGKIMRYKNLFKRKNAHKMERQQKRNGYLGAGSLGLTDFSVRGGGTRPLLLRLLHLIQEVHDALQLGLRQQRRSVSVGRQRRQAELDVTLQVVGRQ